MSEESVATTDVSGDVESVSSEPVELFGDPGDTVSAVMAEPEVFESDGEEASDAPDAPEPPTSEPEAPAKPPRMIALGEAGEFDGDTIVDVKGEKVKLSDLYDGFIGQKEIARRFTEFDKHKKQWEQEVVKRFQENEALTSTKVKRLNELAKEGDHLGVLREMATFAGEDPIEFEQKMVTQALELAERFADMSDEEIKAHWAEKRAAHAQGELKRRDKAEQTKKSQQQREAEIRKTIHAHGLSEAEFAQSFEMLKQDPEIAKKLSSMTPDEATGVICNFYLDSAKEERVMRAINEVAPSHPEKEKLIDMLFRVAEHDYSVEDIKEIASKYLNTGSTTSASENRTKEPASPKKAGKPETGASSAIKDLASLEPEDSLDWDFF